MIIWLASYPRSGNTYFRILLNHFYGIPTYSFYPDTKFAAKPEVRELVGHLPKPASLTEMANAEDVYFIKTHELPQDQFPAIYLVRDGRDVLLSYAWYILTIENPGTIFTPEDFWKILHNLIFDDGYFGGWGRHVLCWSQRQAPTAIIKFEHLVLASKPSVIIRQAFEHINYTFPEKTTTGLPPTFEELHQLHPTFFRQGQIGGWQTEMPRELHKLFWEKYGHTMHQMRYLSGDPNTLSSYVTFTKKPI